MFFLRSLFIRFKNTFLLKGRLKAGRLIGPKVGFYKAPQSQVNFSFKRLAESQQNDPTVGWPANASSRHGWFKSLCESRKTWLLRSSAAVRLQKHPTVGWGFTMLETLIGLALVSATGFVVTFMTANMTTLTQRKHDTYMCSSVAGNVLAHFSKNGSKVSPKKEVATIKKSGGGDQNLSKIGHNTSVDSPLSTSSSGVTLNLDRLYDGSDVGVLEDLYNQYLKISSLNNTSICPTDAQISNSSALTFDLVKMKFDFRSTTPRLGDLDKWIKLNPNEYDTDKNKLKVYEDLADDNGSPSDGYKWDRLTGESLFLLSERLSGISSLSFGPAEPIADYRPIRSYIDKSKYDVRIGIRPWDISKNQKTDSCTRHKSKDIHPIFVRPRSSYDKVDQANKQRDLGYKLASSLSGLPEANIRNDLGFKLFVEVEERKAVSSYDPIRCRAEKVFSYSQRYVTARNKTIVKTTSVTTTTPPVSSFQANLASNKNNNKLVSSKANNNKLVSNNLVSNLANKANSKHNPSTISLSSVSNSEADSSDSSSTSTTTTTLQCTTNSDNSTTCKFKLEGRVWDRGYRCPDGNDAGYCLNSSFSKGVFLCRLNKKISGIDHPVGDWFLCDDLSGSSFTIGDDTHPVTAQLYASDPSDPEGGDRSKDRELHLRFTELPAPDSSIEYSIELRLVDEYGNYSPSPQEDALIFSTTTTTDPCAGVTCTGIQRCNSATGRCECPANHASCRNNAICCNPGNICVNNGCACDNAACAALGKVCSADTSLADRCVNQPALTEEEEEEEEDSGGNTGGGGNTSCSGPSDCGNCQKCEGGKCEAETCSDKGWPRGTHEQSLQAYCGYETGSPGCSLTCYRGGEICTSEETCNPTTKKCETPPACTEDSDCNDSCKKCSDDKKCVPKSCADIDSSYHTDPSYCGARPISNAGECSINCSTGGVRCSSSTPSTPVCSSGKCICRVNATCPGACNKCVSGSCNNGTPCALSAADIDNCKTCPTGNPSCGSPTSRCTNPTPHCKGNNVCVQCTQDSHCSVGWRCNKTNYTCERISNSCDDASCNSGIMLNYPFSESTKPACVTGTKSCTKTNGTVLTCYAGKAGQTRPSTCPNNACHTFDKCTGGCAVLETTCPSNCTNGCNKVASATTCREVCKPEKVKRCILPTQGILNQCWFETYDSTCGYGCESNITGNNNMKCLSSQIPQCAQ